MKRIVWTDSDGRVCVTTPAFNVFEAPGFTEDDAIARALAALPGEATDPRIVDPSELPTDRTFRAAWKADLSIDMGKAREIHKTKLRQLRAPLLVAADIEYMRATESDDKIAQARIVEKKTALRDVTDDPAIASAKTPEALKAVIPDVLTSK